MPVLHRYCVTVPLPDTSARYPRYRRSMVEFLDDHILRGYESGLRGYPSHVPLQPLAFRAWVMHYRHARYRDELWLHMFVQYFERYAVGFVNEMEHMLVRLNGVQWRGRMVAESRGFGSFLPPGVDREAQHSMQLEIQVLSLEMRSNRSWRRASIPVWQVPGHPGLPAFTDYVQAFWPFSVGPPSPEVLSQASWTSQASAELSGTGVSSGQSTGGSSSPELY